jgi:hypothetical protein
VKGNGTFRTDPGLTPAGTREPPLENSPTIKADAAKSRERLRFAMRRCAEEDKKFRLL